MLLAVRGPGGRPGSGKDRKERPGNRKYIAELMCVNA
jgi:hypothetical protein